MGDRLRRSVRCLYRLVCRFLPLYGGEYRLTMSRLANWMYAAERELYATQLRSGLNIMIDPRDMNGRMVDLFGSCDRRISDICIYLVKHVDIFFDVGANYGSVGLQCVHARRRGCMVHFVEPQAELCARIAAVIESNAIANCRIHQCALLHDDCYATLFCPSSHSGAASVVASSGGGTGRLVEVRGTEGFLREQTAGRSFGLKIDAEGASVDILTHALSVEGFRFAVLESGVNESPALLSVVRGQKEVLCYGISKSRFRVSLKLVDSGTDINSFEDFVVIRNSSVASGTTKRLGLSGIESLFRSIALY